MTRRDF